MTDAHAWLHDKIHKAQGATVTMVMWGTNDHATEGVSKVILSGGVSLLPKVDEDGVPYIDIETVG